MAEEKVQNEGSLTDLAGIKPLAKSVEIATQGAVDIVQALFERLCSPALEEYGLLWKDWVHSRRVVAKKAFKKMAENNVPENHHAQPRIVCSILEQSSWIDDSAVQEMWAGLLSSSCTETGDDDSNLLFTNILSNLTKLQARILNYACEHAEKVIHASGLIGVQNLYVHLDTLFSVTGDKDVHRHDLELDNLRDLGLLGIAAGIETRYSPIDHVNLTPSTLALHMYVRCQGSRKTPVEYFSLVAEILR